MAKINYNEILDLTLKVLLKETPNSHIEYNNLFMKNDILENLSNRDKRAILEKLIKDGYVNKMEMSMEAINNYYITLEGILFINSGGYKSKNKKEYNLTIWSYTKSALLVVGTVSATALAVLEIAEKSTNFGTSENEKSAKANNKALQDNKEAKVHTLPTKNTIPKQERVVIQKK